VPTFHPLRVSTVDSLTDDAVAVTFDVPPELREAFDFRAGQHLTLRCVLDGVEVRRNYSICSPAGSGELRVGIKRLSGGAFSAYALDTLRPGEVIDVLTPTGHFTVPFAPDRVKHYAAIAAGSGITPVLSLISTALATEPNSQFTVVYANRMTASVMFLEDLQDLKDRYPDRLMLIHVLSREAQDVELLSGRLDAERLSRLLDVLVPPATVDDWFLCGPFDLVQTARTVLAERGVDRHHVHFELFHVEDAPPPARRPSAGAGGRPATSEVTVILEGRQTTLPIEREGERILDAVLRVRAEAPYACKGGVCGTCRAKLVDGTVEMDRNYALEDDERERGYVLTCQSHPTSDKVTLDYDA
jgi:ring-1,2-phenylacetyl-CoA epoxidase subunit PaaE